MLHFVIVTLFILLLLCTIGWLLLHRRMDPRDLSSHPLYRLHQVLLALIALLAMVLPLAIVLSIDPGDTGNYLYWLQ